MTAQGRFSRRLRTLPVVRLEPHRCAYLPDRTARLALALPPVRSGRHYEQLLRLGFRRSGVYCYTTDCPGCRACIPLRVPVETFRRSRSQRRVWRRNRDVRVTVRRPCCDTLRYELFCRHQAAQFDRPMCPTIDDLRETLFESPIETLELDYWLEAHLIGVGIVDLCPDALSSVYFFFDPDHARRSPGTFSALVEIDLAHQWARRWWYAGYWIRDCPTMRYKSAFRPHELLAPEGWRPVPDA